MSDFEVYQYLIVIVLIMAPLTSISLVLSPISNEQYFSDGPGPVIKKDLAEVIYMMPFLLGFIVFYLQGESSTFLVPLILFSIWISYFSSKMLRPVFFKDHNKTKEVTLNNVLAGALLTTIISYLNSKWISDYGNYHLSWLSDWKFLLGVGLWGVALVLNFQARQWTSPSQSWGDILFASGWALMTFSWVGGVFALYTMANLLPRTIRVNAN
jgi:3-oxo-5-alpha-steroid 4-dehydrogenase 1